MQDAKSGESFIILRYTHPCISGLCKSLHRPATEPEWWSKTLLIQLDHRF